MLSCQHLAQPPSWSTSPCRLSATAYSIYSQLPSRSGGRSSIRNLRTRHAVVTGTDLSLTYCVTRKKPRLHLSPMCLLAATHQEQRKQPRSTANSSVNISICPTLSVHYVAGSFAHAAYRLREYLLTYSYTVLIYTASGTNCQYFGPAE